MAKPSSETRYVIVGASAAGMAAAEAIRQLDPQGSVTVFSDEPDRPYFRPLIPFLISGKKRALDMEMIGQGPYPGVGINVRLSTRVTEIDTRARTVAVSAGGSGGLRESGNSEGFQGSQGSRRAHGSDSSGGSSGEKIGYDKLLIATGSRPNIPREVEGTDAEGVFALRTLADARSAARRVAGTRHAVMLGGGILNLKGAFALLERGLHVTLIVQSRQVLSQLMEPDDATLIRDALNKAGLKIKTGAGARRILSNGSGVRGVLLDDGSEVPCEMVCIGKGVQPNAAFAGAGDGAIRMDRGGVVADRFTACSAPDVYAAGDVAVTFDPITGGRIVTGLWTNAVEMGRCAGYNMAGRPTEYSGTFGILNATQVADVSFVSMGIVHTTGTDHETYTAGSGSAYRKLVFSPDGARLVGVLLVGDISRAGLYRFVIRERMDVGGIKSHIINHTLHYGHFMCR
jgi:NAD(P)H-nitrite reductase large subunit